MVICCNEIFWTAVGGIATAIYAVFTLFLWINSKRILDQTQKLHETDSRPWVQIKQPSQRLAPGERGTVIDVEITNLGKSPARIASWFLSWIDSDGIEKHSEKIHQTVLLPSESEKKGFLFQIEPGSNIPSELTIEVNYSASGPENYISSAKYYYAGGFDFLLVTLSRLYV
jgi:hypothetical protein